MSAPTIKGGVGFGSISSRAICKRVVWYWLITKLLRCRVLYPTVQIDLFAGEGVQEFQEGVPLEGVRGKYTVTCRARGVPQNTEIYVCHDA